MADRVERCWWRFSEYEIQDGCIRPVRRARCRVYAPWAEYRIARNHDEPRPYESLLDLVRDRGPTNYRQLREWVARYGLLGLAPHMAERVVVPSSTGVTVYVRSAAGRWVTESVERGSRPLPETGVLLRDLRAGVAGYQPFETRWKRFFPGAVRAPTADVYPQPLSPEFWREYAEPVEEFIAAARMLRECVETLGRLRDVGPFIGYTHTVPTAVELLGGLSRDTRPVLEWEEDQGQVSRTWDSPSLLGWLARMIEEDLITPDRVLTCMVCGKLFHSALRRAAYCSPRCRATGEKRRQRQVAAQKKPKREREG